MRHNHRSRGFKDFQLPKTFSRTDPLREVLMTSHVGVAYDSPLCCEARRSVKQYLRCLNVVHLFYTIDSSSHLRHLASRYSVAD